MNRRRVVWVVAGVAWAAYLLSWCLPTVDISEPKRFYPGASAFLLALAGAKASDSVFAWDRILCIVGVLSIVPVLLSPFLIRRGTRWFVATLVATFLVNFGWIPEMGISHLGVGYWVWMGSMGLLAAAAIMSRRARS